MLFLGSVTQTVIISLKQAISPIPSIRQLQDARQCTQLTLLFWTFRTTPGFLKYVRFKYIISSHCRRIVCKSGNPFLIKLPRTYSLQIMKDKKDILQPTSVTLTHYFSGNNRCTSCFLVQSNTSQQNSLTSLI